jgi:hypothetical protein
MWLARGMGVARLCEMSVEWSWQASISRTLVFRIAIFFAIESHRHQVAKLEAATSLARRDGAKNRVSPEQRTAGSESGTFCLANRRLLGF